MLFVSYGHPQMEYVDNTYRRKWDKEKYMGMAASKEAGFMTMEEAEKVAAAKKKKVDRKPLQQREEELRLDEMIGKSTIVTSATPLQKQVFVLIIIPVITL